MTILAFLLAAAAGSGARYIVDYAIEERTRRVFPWGTLTVNVAGSFLLGLLSGALLYSLVPDTSRAVLGIGFCGAFTTFSTLAYETVRLYEEGSHLEAVLNIAGTIGAGLAACVAGLALAAAL